jgi:hypothetical protein
MPAEILYRKDPEGLVFIYTGDVIGADIIGVNDKIADQKDCTYQISDFSRANSIKISPKELHRIAIQDCSIPEQYKLEKMAIIGNKAKYARLVDLYYTFAEIWVGKQRQYETRTFDTIEEANEWIGLK